MILRILRRLFPIARWIVDLAVIALVIMCILHTSRRRAISCTWERMRASCAIEAEDSLGRVTTQSIKGIRSAAYRAGKIVGLVTDAENKGELALFGTREIEFDDERDAARFYAFAADRDPDHVEARSGVARPVVVTAFWLGALLVYAVASRFVWSALARRAR